MRKFALLSLLLVIVACSDKRYKPVMYYWPTYYKVMRSQVLSPDEFVPADGARILIDDYSKRSPNTVPPGVNAYIGYLLMADGQRGAAKQFFQNEAELFPESKVWIDRIIRDDLK